MLTLLVQCLSLENAPYAQKYDFDLTKRAIVLGRDQDCDLIISDDQISKNHAKVFQQDGKIILIDLDSTNGLFLMSISGLRRILRYRIHDGDVVRIGTHSVQFYFEDRQSDTHRPSREFLVARNHQIVASGFSVTTRMLRDIIDNILPMDADLDELFVDYFPQVSRRISGNMDRKSKINLLFSLEGHETVFRVLLDVYPKQFDKWLQLYRDSNFAMHLNR